MQILDCFCINARQISVLKTSARAQDYEIIVIQLCDFYIQVLNLNHLKPRLKHLRKQWLIACDVQK